MLIITISVITKIPCLATGELLFRVIQVEVAVFVELLAFLRALPRFSVVGVKLVMQVKIPIGFVSANKVCVLLQRMILIIAHVSDRNDQTQP